MSDSGESYSGENSSELNTSDEDLDGHLEGNLQMDDIQGYQFQPRRDSYTGESESDGSDVEDELNHTDGEIISRLNNLNWCTCENCQMMDREVECVCCQETQVMLDKNEEVFEVERPQKAYSCITQNPGFHAVCTNRWALQAAWFQYKQQYGSQAFEGPEHKIQRHVAYRQLVRWCWGVIGKNIRVVLPACAVSCIRAHFPPPGEEDEHEFIGFHFADE